MSKSNNWLKFVLGAALAAYVGNYVNTYNQKAEHRISDAGYTSIVSSRGINNLSETGIIGKVIHVNKLEQVEASFDRNIGALVKFLEANPNTLESLIASTAWQSGYIERDGNSFYLRTREESILQLKSYLSEAVSGDFTHKNELNAEAGLLALAMTAGLKNAGVAEKVDSDFFKMALEMLGVYHEMIKLSKQHDVGGESKDSIDKIPIMINDKINGYIGFKLGDIPKLFEALNLSLSYDAPRELFTKPNYFASFSVNVPPLPKDSAVTFILGPTVSFYRTDSTLVMRAISRGQSQQYTLPISSR